MPTEVRTLQSGPVTTFAHSQTGRTHRGELMLIAKAHTVFLLACLCLAATFLGRGNTSLAFEVPTLPNGPRARSEASAKQGQQKVAGRWREAPAWQVDLRSLGIARVQGGKEVPHSGRASQSIFFSTHHTLVVTFHTREIPATAPDHAGRSGPWPSRLQALFLDANNGQVRTTREWFLPTGEGSIIPTAHGKLVLITPDHIVLYSSELEPLKELCLPPPGLQNASLDEVRHSPRGKSILLVYRSTDDLDQTRGPVGRGRYDFVSIDAGTLSVVRTWKENGWENTWQGPEPINSLGGNVDEISDDGILRHLGGAIILRKFDESWRLACYLRPYCGRARFVDNQTLMLRFRQTPGPWRENSIGLLGTDGRLQFAQQLGYKENDRLGPIAVSADGHRFAILLYRLEGEIDFADYHIRSPHTTLQSILVYDIPSRHWLFGLEANKKMSRYEPAPGGFFELPEYALSPDGSLMAILADDSVQVYRLPPPCSGSAAAK